MKTSHALLSACLLLFGCAHAAQLPVAQTEVIVQLAAGISPCPGGASAEFLPSMQVRVLRRSKHAALVQWLDDPQRTGWVPLAAIAPPSAFKPVRAWNGPKRFWDTVSYPSADYDVRPDGAYSFEYKENVEGTSQVKVTGKGAGQLYGYGQAVEARDVATSGRTGALNYFWLVPDGTLCILNAAAQCNEPVAPHAVPAQAQQPLHGSFPAFDPDVDIVANPKHFDSWSAFRTAHPHKTEQCGQSCPQILDVDLNEDGVDDRVVFLNVNRYLFQIFVLMGDGHGGYDLSGQSQVFQFGVLPVTIGKDAKNRFHLAFSEGIDGGAEELQYTYRFGLRDGAWRWIGEDDESMTTGSPHKVTRSFDLLSGRYWIRLSSNGKTVGLHRDTWRFPARMLSDFRYTNDDTLDQAPFGYGINWLNGFEPDEPE